MQSLYTNDNLATSSLMTLPRDAVCSPGFLLVDTKHAASCHARGIQTCWGSSLPLPCVVPLSRHALPKQLLSMLPGKRQ